MARENSSRAWQTLPECMATSLSRLDAPEVQRLRLVCKDWRRGVSIASLAGLNYLNPRSWHLQREHALCTTSADCMLSSLQLLAFAEYQAATPSMNSFAYICLPRLTRLTLGDCETLQDRHLSVSHPSCFQSARRVRAYCFYTSQGTLLWMVTELLLGKPAAA